MSEEKTYTRQQIAKFVSILILSVLQNAYRRQFTNGQLIDIYNRTMTGIDKGAIEETCGLFDEQTKAKYYA